MHVTTALIALEIDASILGARVGEEGDACSSHGKKSDIQKDDTP
jgi:hypothetical protein